MEVPGSNCGKFLSLLYPAVTALLEYLDPTIFALLRLSAYVPILSLFCSCDRSLTFYVNKCS